MAESNPFLDPPPVANRTKGPRKNSSQSPNKEGSHGFDNVSASLDLTKNLFSGIHPQNAAETPGLLSDQSAMEFDPLQLFETAEMKSNDNERFPQMSLLGIDDETSTAADAIGTLTTDSSSIHLEVESPSSKPADAINPNSTDDIQKEILSADEQIRKHQNAIDKLNARRQNLVEQLSPDEQKKYGPSLSQSLKPSCLINAIEWMQKGAPMLKYGKLGYPHFRYFEISEDRKWLRWYSAGKTQDKTRVLLHTIKKIELGQITPKFQRYLQPRLNKCSFSLFYEDSPKEISTLDVIAKNKSDFQIWTTGLRSLIEYRKKEFRGQSTDAFDDIIVTVEERNEAQIERRLGRQPAPPKHLVDREMNLAKRQFNDINALARKQTCDNPEIIKVQTRLAELENELDQLRDIMESKPLNVASHEIWRTAVELKALDHKVRVLAKARH